MTIEVWAAFALAAAVILVIPGPTIILVVTQAITHGRKSVIPLVIGVMCGDFAAMTLSLLGLGAILSVSVTLFAILKWIGAGYLFYLGIRLWRSDPEKAKTALSDGTVSGRSLLKSSFAVTALNPKSIAFFVAFLPQFVNPREPAAMQLLILGATFVSMAGINAGIYAVFAGQLREKMHSIHARKWFNRCGSGALIGAGIFTAAMQKSS